MIEALIPAAAGFAGGLLIGLSVASREADNAIERMEENLMLAITADTAMAHLSPEEQHAVLLEVNERFVDSFVSDVELEVVEGEVRDE